MAKKEILNYIRHHTYTRDNRKDNEFELVKLFLSKWIENERKYSRGVVLKRSEIEKKMNLVMK